MRNSDPTVNRFVPSAVCCTFGIAEGIALGVSVAVSAATSIISMSQQASAQNAAAAAQAQQAENARAMAQYNADIARQNNEVAYQMALYQASYAQQMAQVNQAMALSSASMAEMQGAYAQKSYEQQLENAKQKEMQADATRAQSREAADRERAKNEAAIGLLRSKVGASGVAFEGSPLVILSEAARLGEATVQDIAYGGELQSRKELREAEIQKFESVGSLLEAKGASVEAANLRNRAAMYEYEGNLAAFDTAIAGAQYRIGLNQAKLVELGGEEKAFSYEFASQQSSMQASASTFSGYAGAANSLIGGVTTGIKNYGLSTGKYTTKD